NALVISEITDFSYDTRSFKKLDGSRVTLPPQRFIRVLVPLPEEQRPIKAIKQALGRKALIPPERILEEFLARSPESIEPGLRVEARQLVTPAGRLDLLCRDTEDRYVVVELKIVRGTDQVIGQLLRYMGWVKEHYATEEVRGIVVALNKDERLDYAIKAVAGIEAKEFKFLIE